MKQNEDESMRYAVHGLHLTTSAEVSDAWTELFRLGIRWARVARERAKQAESAANDRQELPDEEKARA